MTLLDRYGQWSEKRQAIWTEEAEGWDEYDQDDLGYSDDEGVDLLGEFASAYEGLLRATSGVIASWRSGAPSGWAASIKELEQVAMLDSASSASRQHYIDTGRYLQEGEAL